VVSRNHSLQCAKDWILLRWYAPFPFLSRSRSPYTSPALVPVTILSSDTVGKRQGPTDVPFHPKYDGTVLFKNKFDGQLPATDYPKVNFYLAMLLVYVLFASAWGWLCYRHVQDLLPIQVRDQQFQNAFLT